MWWPGNAFTESGTFVGSVQNPFMASYHPSDKIDIRPNGIHSSLNIYITYKTLFYMYIKFYLFCILFLVALSLHCCMGFSLVAENGGYSLAAVPRLLTAMPSAVAKHSVSDARASVLAALGL